jgi:hypothetical protein
MAFSKYQFPVSSGQFPVGILDKLETGLETGNRTKKRRPFGQAGGV